MAEQLVTEKDNSQQGVTTVKMGAVFNLIEPLTLSGAGSEIGAFFFLEPKRLFDFIAPDQGGINTKANYDVGVFGVTQVLPLTLSFDYMLKESPISMSFSMKRKRVYWNSRIICSFIT